MITLYLKSYNKVVKEVDVKVLDNLGYDDILWIDMFDPTIKERRAVEEYMEFSLQTRQQIEEIESSSRYSETERVVYCNTNFPTQSDRTFEIAPVSFALCEGVLISERTFDSKTFAEASKKIQINYKQYPTGFHILITLLEVRIDLDADMIEMVSRQVGHLGKHITLEGNVDKDMLRRLTLLQDNSMVLRENIFDRQRVYRALCVATGSPTTHFHDFR